MFDPLTESPGGRRFVITMGASRFRDLPAEAALGRVEADMRSVAGLFEGYGYEHVLQGFAQYASPDHVRTALGQWVSDIGLGARDTVVVYFAGHGIVEERDRHYLLLWSSNDQQPAATALPTEDVMRILIGTGLRSALLLLDTCYGSAAAADGASLALQTVARRFAGDQNSTGLWFLSSARAKDEAVDGAFVDLLPAAIEEVAARSGQRQRYLDLTDLVGQINDGFRDRRLGQRAELVAGLVTGLPPFIPNPAYRERLPPVGTDLEVQTRAAAREIDLTEHFGPRSRGVEFESEQGMYFSGRRLVLTRIVDWLTAPASDGRGRILTGSPGSGKSAVLGRIVALSAPGYRAAVSLAGADPRTIVPEDTVQVAIHARHKRLEDVVSRFAAELGLAADSPSALLYELNRRSRDAPPIVAVLDALDEAGSGTAADTGGRGEPRRIARDLLRPMSEIPGVRLLIGTRRELISSLGTGFEMLDLDAPAYADDEDVAGYVAAVLLAADEPDVKTPYRGKDELAKQIGRAVAQRASGVYLVARMASRSLRSATEPVDTGVPGWMDLLPSEIGEAFDDYLFRFGPDEERVRRLLMPLALAEGQGLPRGEVWLRLATELSGTATTDADLAWVLTAANSYVAEVTDHGRSVYRLYHQSLAEHLRRTPTLEPAEAQSRIVDALVSLAPPYSREPTGAGAGAGTGGQRRDWFAAPPYVRANLATHAAAAGRIDELVGEPGFLLASEQLPLLRGLTSARSAEAKRIRNAYEQVAHQVVDTRALGERAAYLQLSARRCGAGDLADSINRLGIDLPWSTRWAWYSPTGVHRQLRGHESGLNAVSVGELDGRPIALTGSWDGTARIWDLTTQKQLGPEMKEHKDVTAVAFGEIGDYTLALTGGDDGIVRIFDVSTGRELGEPLTGHTNEVSAIAVGQLDGTDIAVTASADGTARVWDLTLRRQLGEPFLLHRSAVNGVALGVLDGRPICITGGNDNRARVWDMATHQAVGSALIGHTGAIKSVTLTRIDGRTIVVTGCADGTVGLWDLANRQQIGEPLWAHFGFIEDDRAVRSVAMGRLGESSILITCARQEARVWDLRTLRRIGQPLTGHAGVMTAAVFGMVNGLPAAVTAGADRTARIWDLTAENPAADHTGDINVVATCTFGRRRLAITGGEDTMAQIWDLSERRQFGCALEGHIGPVTAVTVGRCADRTVAVTGSSDATVRLWDVETGQPLTTPLVGHTNEITRVLLVEHSGGPAVITGSRDGTVRLWSVETGRELRKAFTGHRGSVNRLATGKVDGVPALVVGTNYAAYVWPLDAPDPDRGMIGMLEDDDQRLGLVQEVGVVNGRPVLLAVGEDNAVRCWDVLRGCETATRLSGHTSHVNSVTLTTVDDRPMVATTSFDLTLRFWDLNTGDQDGPVIPLHSYRPRVSLCGSDAVVCEGGVMRMWDRAASQPIDEPLSGLDYDTGRVALSRLGERQVLVTSALRGAGPTVRFHDLETGTALARQLITRFQSGFAAAIPEDELRTVISGMYTGNIDVWDAREGRLLETLDGHDEMPAVFAFLTVAGRRLVISGSQDASLKIWDGGTWKLCGEPPVNHTAEITALVAAEVSGVPLAITASRDGTVRLWELPSGTPSGDVLLQQDHAIHTLALGARGSRPLLIVGDVRGKVQAYDLESREFDSVLLEPDNEFVRALWAGALDGHSVVVVGDSAGRIRVVSLEDGSLRSTIELEIVISDLLVSDDGMLAVSSNLGVITLGLLGRPGKAAE